MTCESSPAGGPSMLICVETEASRDCGAGETVTREPASAAEMFSRGGTQRGETLGSLNLLAVAVASAPARPERSTSDRDDPAPATQQRTRRRSRRVAARGGRSLLDRGRRAEHAPEPSSACTAR